MDFLPQTIRDYAEAKTSPETAALQELNRRTKEEVSIPQMLSGHLQGRFLSMVSQMVRPKTILDIGTFTGYSALCLAEGLVEGGKVITLEQNQELEGFIREHIGKAGLSERIDLRIGNAKEIIASLPGPFDLVFIDADKEGYLDYYNQVLPKLSAHGQIVVDNVLWSGKVIDDTAQDSETNALREFNDYVANDPRTIQVLLPIRDGLMLVRMV
jgi:predicted O-methyltransferase YrrM